MDRVQVLRSRLLLDATELHVRTFFRGHEGVTLRHHRRCRGVLVVPPGPRTPHWTYLSLAASVPRRAPGSLAHELLLVAPVAGDAHVELVALAAAHADALGPGARLALDAPWSPGSACTWLLCGAPHPFGPELAHSSDALGPVRILRLVPVTGAEAAFVERHGAAALEQRLDDAGVDLADPGRRSVV